MEEVFDNLPQIQLLELNHIEANKGQMNGLPANPRKIDDPRYELLKQSIIDTPQFLKYNPLKVYPLDDRKFIVIGGNMRYLALSELGFRFVPCVVFPKGTDSDTLKKYVILDNAGFGAWDWQALKNDADWSEQQLTAWGVELPDDWNTADTDNQGQNDDNESYSRKVIAPTYEPSGKTPTFGEMYDTTKRDALITDIDKADIPDEVREFLREAARRHTVFNYEKIADYYAQAPAKIQDLMERSALVIIDFDKAIEGGYITMTKDLANAYRIERNITDEDELTESDISDDYDEE
ncbi:MAG: hypothetical protein NC411_01245 [Bacteroides sp.]|nr:hypothetical protein [Bacteroides sp.]